LIKVTNNKKIPHSDMFIRASLYDRVDPSAGARDDSVYFWMGGEEAIRRSLVGYNKFYTRIASSPPPVPHSPCHPEFLFKIFAHPVFMTTKDVL
jgi:hypothetical protein